MPITYRKDLYSKNGALLYSGEGYKKGDGSFVRQGKGKQFYEDGGVLYEGDFSAGQMHGRGKIFDRNGNLWYEGEFAQGERTGRGALYDKNILRYEGDFQKGRWEGQGRLYREDASLLYEGGFKDGRLEGQGRQYYESGALEYAGEFFNGKWNGKGTLYGEDGKLQYEGEFAEGTMTGVGKEFRKDGKLWYHGDFVRGQRHGRGTLYDKEGRPKYEGTFVNGQVGGSGCSFFTNGSVEYVGSYQDGDWSGKGKQFFSNGALAYEGDFLKGKWHGRGSQYNENGKLLYSGEFRNGEIFDAAARVKAHEGDSLEDCLTELRAMPGLETVKAEIYDLVDMVKEETARKDATPVSFHVIFTGNPGTGKSEVAAILSRIYAALGVVSKGTLVTTGRQSLVVDYIGRSHQQVEAALQKAKGGILFIEDANTLLRGQYDMYGREAIERLVKGMGEYWDDLAVVMSGYPNQMDRFLKANPLLEARFCWQIPFRNFTAPELLAYLRNICEKAEYSLQVQAEAAFEYNVTQQLDNPEFVARFTNMRYVRNLFERLKEARKRRLELISPADAHAPGEITIQDMQVLVDHRDFERAL